MSDQRPHIILITTDEQRGDCLGIDGHAVLRTPFLDHLAASGVVFPRAHTTCPVCIPARRSLLSGLHPGTHGMNENLEARPFSPPATLPGLLRAAGWQTQLIGKFHVAEPGVRLGFDSIIQSETPNDRRSSQHQRRNDYADWYERQPGAGPHTLYNGIMSNGRTARPWTQDEHLHHSNWLTEQAARYLGDLRDPSCPFFLHLSYWGPHQPLLPPQCYWDRYAGHGWEPVIGGWVGERAWRPGVHPDDERGPFRACEMADARRGYLGLINHIDDLLTGLFDRWQGSRLRPDRPVWVIFASDHGDMNGDHHLFRKRAPYEGATRIPFFISGLNGARVPRPGISRSLACLEDVLPTALGLAGLDLPTHLGELDGRDLAPCLEGGDGGRTQLIANGVWKGRQPWLSRLDADGRKYIRWQRTGEEQVFDLATDPGECRDLSGACDLADDRAAVDAYQAASAIGADAYAPLQPCAGCAPQAIWG